MSQENFFRINTPHVISETIDGETIIINLESGNYYSLNKMGGEIWNAIGSWVSKEKIFVGLAKRHAEPLLKISEAVQAFIQVLLNENLIVPAPEEIQGSPASYPAEANAPSPPFEKPELQKYDDMQDLLLLDPIHDVDETGWPATSEKAS